MHITKTVSFSEAIKALHHSVADASGFHLWSAILFGGDRATCCDEAIIIEVNDRVVSIVSLAPKGEQDSGEPTIVGLYTVPAFRKKGYGQLVLEAAIQRMSERGFRNVRIDALSPGAMKCIGKLSLEVRNRLRVHDQSSFGALIRD